MEVAHVCTTLTMKWVSEIHHKPFIIHKRGLSSLRLTALQFMTDQFLFDCFVQCTPKKPFEMEEECIDNWNRKQPPIVDILVITEKNIDVWVNWKWWWIASSKWLFSGDEPRQSIGINPNQLQNTRILMCKKVWLSQCDHIQSLWTWICSFLTVLYQISSEEWGY